MNDFDLQNVLNDVKEYDKIFSEKQNNVNCGLYEFRITYKLGGNYLWVKLVSKKENDIEIMNGYKNFSLRNLDKLLKFLKKERIVFSKFEIQN